MNAKGILSLLNEVDEKIDTDPSDAKILIRKIYDIISWNNGILAVDFESQENPDVNGWWWIKDWSWPGLQVVCVYSNLMMFRDGLGDRFNVNEYAGKWYKAIMP